MRYNPTQTILDCARENDAIDHVTQQIETRERIACIASRRYIRDCDIMRLHEPSFIDANFMPSDA